MQLRHGTTPGQPARWRTACHAALEAGTRACLKIEKRTNGTLLAQRFAPRIFSILFFDDVFFLIVFPYSFPFASL
jgi:hypothetical protein